MPNFSKKPAVATKPSVVVHRGTPNGSSLPPAEQQAVVDTTSEYSERGVLMRTEHKRTNLPMEDEIPPTHIVVDTGQTVRMSISFQTVETHVRVLIPSGLDEDSVKATYKRAWSIIDEQLDERAAWAKETIQGLAQIRKDTER